MVKMTKWSKEATARPGWSKYGQNMIKRWSKDRDYGPSQDCRFRPSESGLTGSRTSESSPSQVRVKSESSPSQVRVKSESNPSQVPCHGRYPGGALALSPSHSPLPRSLCPFLTPPPPARLGVCAALDDAARLDHEDDVGRLDLHGQHSHDRHVPVY
jgi:hypothetical protein